MRATRADIRVADVNICYVAWDAAPVIEPETAADALIDTSRTPLSETTTSDVT